MALLNPPEILPPVIRAVVEAVALYGSAVDDDKLIELLSPGPADRPGSIGRESKPHVVNGHRAARELGLLVEAEGGSDLTDLARKALQRGSLRPTWSSLLRSQILHHDSAAEAVPQALAGDTTGVRDLVLALTWFLAQDSLDRPMRWEMSDGYRDMQSLQQAQFGRTSRGWPIQNDTRFGAFERWATHLGFGVDDELGGGRAALRPLPVSPIRGALHNVGGGYYELGELCSLLAEQLPCLWPGTYRSQLAEALGEDPDPDVKDGGIDSSVGAALLVLEFEGVLRLENHADAATRLVIAPKSQGARQVTHAQVGEA